MRIKKTYRKKTIVDNEKENLTYKNTEGEQILPIMMENSKHSEIENNSDIDLIKSKEEQSAQEGFDNELSSSGINEDILSSFLRDDTNVTEGSEDISWFLVDGTNATEGSEDISSFLLKDINLPGNNQMSMFLLLSLKNHGSFINLVFESQQGQKRSFEHHTDTMENEKHSDLSNDVSSDDMPNLKRKFVELEAKLETLKAEWMRM
ncbi:unnamed protein product [Rotaria sp. Silwood1]|nr:unnamed protein product [Rotaria sp. Silwood1]